MTSEFGFSQPWCTSDTLETHIFRWASVPKSLQCFSPCISVVTPAPPAHAVVFPDFYQSLSELRGNSEHMWSKTLQKQRWSTGSCHKWWWWRMAEVGLSPHRTAPIYLLWPSHGQLLPVPCSQCFCWVSILTGEKHLQNHTKMPQKCKFLPTADKGRGCADERKRDAAWEQSSTCMVNMCERARALVCPEIIPWHLAISGLSAARYYCCAAESQPVQLCFLSLGLQWPSALPWPSPECTHVLSLIRPAVGVMNIRESLPHPLWWQLWIWQRKLTALGARE